MEGKRKFQWEKQKSREKAKKGIRAQENSNVRGHAQITKKKVTSKIKWVYPSKAKRKKKAANQIRVAKEKMNDIKSRIVDSGP
jgi:hypothetical protein